MIALIPPVGYPVTMAANAAATVEQHLSYPGYVGQAYASGTASLAAALMIARERAPGVHSPEVIVPAYGCPDLVAAAIHVGLQPVVVDIESAFHGFDLDALTAAVNERTVAVVAVNLLGMRERIGAIRERLATAVQPVTLIEDDAQCLPEPVGNPGAVHGDCVVLSFGRGKPVSLLGGGLLLVRDALGIEPPQPSPQSVNALALRFKVAVYNRLLAPACFGLVSRLPGLQIGATTLHLLETIEDMDPVRRRWLSRNLANYTARDRSAETAVAQMLELRDDLEDAAASAPAGCGRLLRYPVLARDATTREQWVIRLRAAGFGATAMYQRPLVEIDGVRSRVTTRGDYPNASHYAARLLTLPLQSGIDAQSLQRLEAALG